MLKDYKDTLLMPKTDFEMKAGLVGKEPDFRRFWSDNKIYEKSLELNKGNERMFLHDGPPYANGSLHVGHALNKILKDIIVRNKAMNGFYTPFVYGWDTHGLPIENKMLAEMKMTKDDLDQFSLRKEAAKYANKQVDVQAVQFESMSLFANMNNRYITLDKEFEVGQLKLFKKMLLSGLAYKGLKPVYWSPSSQSALAEAEVEYEDHISPQVIVSFKVIEGNSNIKAEDNLLIMTTTPWTLIANSGVAVGENFDYDIVEANGKRYVIASELTSNVMSLAKFEEFQIINTIKGKDIEGVKYQRPIKRDETGPVILGHHVTTDAGTGLVHMAPLFGEDDYIVGKKTGLDMIMHVDDKGNLNSEAGKYEGLFYADANKDIGMFLDEQGELLSLKFLKHSYPHDWRTHKPVIYRGVPQWFVSIKNKKQEILDALSSVTSTPEWGISRISQMIENRDEWTISRQRTWGVPIIAFYDKDGNAVIEEQILDYVIELVAQHGSDIWWEKEADELLPDSYRGKGFTKEMDIMDVWFDSGSSSITPQTRGEMLENLEGAKEIYLEGSDQYRGWFNSSLINSVIYRGESPYKKLISHGFVLDGKQQKMSKSKGNVIDPLEIINKNGADILRLWAANSEYTSDVSISQDIIKQTIDIYRKIRNTIKFMLGNLFDFDSTKKVELNGVHNLIDERLNNLKHNVAKAYDEYKFQNVVKSINLFLTETSGFYFESHKDALYVEKSDSYERRAVQTNIYNILDFIIWSIAPILPTTSEEAYRHFDKLEKRESIFLEVRKYDESLKTTEEEKWAEFFNFKDEAYKILEEAKKEKMINRTNQAFLTVKTNSKFIKSLDLAQLLMVGKVEFGNEFKVKTFESEKCQRCWNHFEIGKLNNDSICNRCEGVIS